MSIKNLCESFEKELDSKLGDLRNTRGSLRNKLNELDDKINGISGKDEISDIRNKVNEKSREIKDAMKGLTDDITKYTGSCLDGIVNSLNDVRNDAESLIGNTLDFLDGDWNNLSSSLGGYTGLLDKLGIRNLVGGLNNLFGCLADNNACLPIGKLDEIMNELEAFEGEFGLNMDGDFDADSYLSTKGISEALKGNVKELTDSMKNVVVEVKDLTSKKDSFKVPSNLI